MERGYRSGVNASRRKVLVALAAFAAMQYVPTLAIAASRGAGAKTDELDEFIRLSVAVTGVAALDRDAAMGILKLIHSEPWGKEHLAQIGGKILAKTEGRTRQQLLDPARFTDGERWFIGHLLTTWYTGVYYHQIDNHVVTYRDALMYVALQDVRPIPGHCDGTFGFWSAPPAGAIK